MKRPLCILVCLALAACGGSGAPDVPTRTAISGSNGFDAAYNTYRAQQGLSQMRPDPTLARAARAHAQDMERGGFFSHTSPNGDSFQDPAQDAGCNLRAGAENIAQGQRSEIEVLNAWANSPGHRENLEGAAYRLYGLGRSGNTWVMKLAASC